MSGQGMLTFLVLLLLGFIGFVIYFIFKILQFVLVSVNLYKKMVTRQDAMINLLIDIRDKTKKYDKKAIIDKEEDVSINYADDSSKYVKEDKDPPIPETAQNSVPEREPGAAAYCPQCRSPFREGFTKCKDCGVELIRYDDVAKKEVADSNFCYHCGEVFTQRQAEELKRCPKCKKEL